MRTTHTRKTNRRWVPVRRGTTYCSPGCGGGCTMKAYDSAKTLAVGMAKALGPGYRPGVHENLGWYASAVSRCGRLKIHAHIYVTGRLTYTAFFGEPPDPGGRWMATRREPRTAARAVLDNARTALARMGALLTNQPAVGPAARRRR